MTAIALVATVLVTAVPAAAVQPGNDDFAGARVVSGALPLFITGANSEATKQPGEPAHAGNAGGASVWYSWTPDVPDTVAIDTCSSGFVMDTVLGVYTGSAVDALTEVASNDDGGCLDNLPIFSRVVIEAAAGTTYFIAIDGFNGEQSGFTLSVHDATPPPNDSFASAIPIDAALPASIDASNINATTEPAEPAHAGLPAAASVWFSWTPDATADVEIDTCIRGFDSVLVVYTGDAVSGLTTIASNDDGCGGNHQSKLAFPARAGTTYHIAVDGYQGAQGLFTLTVTDASAPPNDALANAEELSGALPLVTTGDNVGATKELGEPDHAGDAGGASVWYRWTASTTGTVEVSTCGEGTGIDSLLAVYTGTSVDTLVPVASNDDDCSRQSRLAFAAAAGEASLIAVDGWHGGQGGITLTLTDLATRPAHDQFADAEVLSGPLPIEASGSNVGATAESGEPDHLYSPAEQLADSFPAHLT